MIARFCYLLPVLLILTPFDNALGSIQLAPGESKTGTPSPLTYSSGLDAEDGWAVEGEATLTGTVLLLADGSAFVYTYTFSTPTSISKGISHIIIEASPAGDLPAFGSLSGDIFDVSFTAGGVAVTSYDLSIGNNFAGGGANPSMPGDMFGIKFSDPYDENEKQFDETTWTVSFKSLRVPVWGDFYAKDGVDGGVVAEAWNLGFTNPDSDPDDQVGALHIPVPDSAVIPEPAAFLIWSLLGALGGAGAWWRKQKAA